jgi:hypothetical protein
MLRTLENDKRSLGFLQTHLQHQQKIKLNVGGTIFQTSTTTLVNTDKGSLLEAIALSDDDSLKDSEGCFVLDRDPSHFRLILNYLRDKVSIFS